MALLQASEKDLPETGSGGLKGLLGKAYELLTSSDGDGRAGRNALIAFMIRVVSAAIAFISQIVLARMMGQHEYGIFVFVWVLVILIGNLSCLGFHSAQIRFLPQFEAVNDVERIRGLTATARLFALMSSTGVLLVGLVALHFAQGLIESYYVMPLYIALFILPMIALGDTMEGTARANSWAIAALSPTYIIRPVLILVFMLGAVWMGAAQTAQTAIVAGLAAAYVTTVGQFFNITWRLRRRFDRGPAKVEFAPWFRVAIPIFLIEGFIFLLTNSDTVVTGLFLAPSEVAIYFAASKTMALVQFVYFSVKAATAPHFSALFAGDDREALAKFSGQSVRWVFWPSLLVGLTALALGNFLLGMFGEGFTAGYNVMVILFFGIMCKAAVGPGEVLLTMAGQQSLCVKLYVVALAANIGLNLLLIPLYGIQGAATAAALAMLVEAVLLHVAVRSRLKITLFIFARPELARPNPEDI
ncbi:oligosaccharide flippase family protein [Rhizobium sp. LjRoot254]|uniref:oligosaccharide flippase family protein n=1 Tax=Rhizobium sp. LjRoot254 TaxID=3342297 RepID=UPI003ECC373D